MLTLRRAVLVLVLAAAGVNACGDDDGLTSSAPTPEGQPSGRDAATTPGADGGGGTDEASTDAGPPAEPIDASAITPCSADGDFPFRVPDASCFTFKPTDTGAAATGQNASDNHWAVRPDKGPAGPAPSSLVLFLIGTGGKPSGAMKSGPRRNFYAAAAQNDRAILGVSYANDVSIGMICQQTDACFFPARESVIRGEAQPGATVTITKDEGILDRASRALRYLAAGDPGGNWGQFLDPATTLAWPKIMTAGHSQGGGHAAAIGKLFPVTRVIQLSSVCDRVGDTAASWTNGKTAPWASDPTQFFGLGTAGDETCPGFTANWQNLGMAVDHREPNGVVCADSPADTHSQSLKCADNYPRWVKMLAP